jgi:excisionase family DNA binding protein
MSGRDWLTVEAAAERLGLTQNAVRGRIKRGTLPAIRRGSRVFVVLPRAVASSSDSPVAAPGTATNPATTPIASATLARLAGIAEERQRQIVALRGERDRLADQLTRQQRLLEREQRLRERLQDQFERLSRDLHAAPAAAEPPAAEDPVETADQLWRRLERQVRRLNGTGDSER